MFARVEGNFATAPTMLPTMLTKSLRLPLPNDFLLGVEVDRLAHVDVHGERPDRRRVGDPPTRLLDARQDVLDRVVEAGYAVRELPL
jgi:hypothetical protein